ncbi:DUF3244 domain-containing protein [uncultured Methanobrevibacter sp.]|uniref:DUF3244 domain-containing protein n=1 Tax=uncultured Methanobrevibacter sp. TaxID=253161 RepID=UPI002631B090|nr:DUF3244 domain-containing protein [uncultured Methanobrevibacter sp.]
MEIKDIIIFVVIVFIAAIVGSMIFSPGVEAEHTTLSILNTGDIAENGTVYVKLAGDTNGSLSDKKVNVELKNDKGEVVYADSVKTHSTGVGIIKLENMSAGKYNVNITFDGDENYSASSISQEITISGDVTNESVENSTLIEQTLEEDSASQTGSSSSTSHTTYTYSSSSRSSSSSSSSSSSGGSEYYDNYYDSDGGRVLKEYDSNGKVIDPDSL